MTGPAFTRFCSEYRRTGILYAVDQASGEVVKVPHVRFLLIEGTREASIYSFHSQPGQAYAEQARVLAKIAGRN